METLQDWLHKAVEWSKTGNRIFEILIGLGALVTVYRELRRILHWLKPNLPVKHGIERIAFHFRTQQSVHIYGLYRKEPTIEVKGRVTLTEEEKALLAKLPTPKEDDPHAIVFLEPDWSLPRPHFEVKSLRYSEVQALSRSSHNPEQTVRLLSGNALVLCRARKQLILHKRAKGVRTYEERLHTIGGGYMPPGLGPEDDGLSIRNTVTREVYEEVDVTLDMGQAPLLITEEVRTGFLQVAFLGVNISEEQADRIPDNPNPAEGRPVKISFSELPDTLLLADWVPTGKAAVLAWLALGAPGAGWHPRFGKYRASELFEETVSRPHADHGDQAITKTAGK